MVVHGLAHIAHRDHSAAFWQRVAAVLPSYRRQQAWLRENRKVIDII